MFDFTSSSGFDWDEGNKHKNWIKHKVSYTECEEVFFNQPLFIRENIKHSSQEEKRYYAYGQTNSGRTLSLVFTLRNNNIRVISARDQSRKERKQYEQQS
jgi:uncharacterized protein